MNVEHLFYKEVFPPLNKTMNSVHSKNTAPELKFRKALWSYGLTTKHVRQTSQENLILFFLQNTSQYLLTVIFGMEGPPVYEKCRQNLNEGFRVFLLVPERSLSGAKYEAEAKDPGRITVLSIESFVGQNIEELSYFSKNKLTSGLANLLEIYNQQRVDAQNLISRC